MEKLRNLSGIYFRAKIDDKWENVCFEELSEEQQDEIIKTKSPEFVVNLAKALARTVIDIGNELNLTR